ncbi:MAG: sulfotransferase [Candidatus Sedimenticola sp. PURPLELP]
MNEELNYLGENLVLVLSAPRSGSTLLQRMIGSHSAVFTHPEPHILTPLVFQGYFYSVDDAPYNHKVAAKALTEFVEELPEGEEDYLNACREYCRVLYTRILEGTGARYFLDKTPNYADTILPSIRKILPKAKYIVLTRHPLAIMSSQARTYYGSSYDLALYSRNIIHTFIPPIADLLRDDHSDHLHVCYEDLVENPEAEMHKILEFLSLKFEGSCIEYGKQRHLNKTYGDPKVNLHDRPVTSSIDRWTIDLLEDPSREKLCHLVLGEISDEDLENFGYPREKIWNALDQVRSSEFSARRGIGYILERTKWSVFWWIKRVTSHGGVDRGIKRVRHWCDVLLR